MKTSFSARNFVKSVAYGFVGVTSIFGISPKSEAATVYPVVNNQVVRFELSNGVALNLQKAILVNDAPVYSYTGNNSDTEQHFKVISNGDAYNFQLNGTGFSISSSTLTPTNGSPMVKYQSGFGIWQDFWLDDAPGNGYYLMKWRNNPNYCVNIPGSASNVRYTLFTCNATDNDQRFRIVNIANEQYSAPMANGSVGVLESATGKRIILPGNNTTPGLANPNDNDPAQKIQFLQVGNNQYVLQSSGTNYSLSSNTLDYVTSNTPGMGMTTYNTGSGRWQNFGFKDLGNNWFQIKYSWNPNYCMSAGTNAGNIAYIVPCNSGDNRQRFRVGVSTTTFESWLIARYSLKANVPTLFFDAAVAALRNTQPEVGHNWVALIKFNRITNALNLIETYSIRTLSYWPDGNDNNNTNDLNNTFSLVGYYGRSNLAAGVRKLRISENKYNQFLNRSASQVGCTTYTIVAGKGNCTCVTRATKEWEHQAGENYTKIILPDSLADKLNTDNSSGQYANGGNILQ
jgi:hypothetical protein